MQVPVWRPLRQAIGTGKLAVLNDQITTVIIAIRLSRERPCQTPGCPTHHIIALIGWLDSDNEVVAVGDHHVCHLVQGLPSHLNAIDFEDLITDCQQPCTFSQAPSYQAGDEDAWDPFQALGSYTHAHAISDVETQGTVGTMLVQPHPSVGLRQ